LLHLATPFLSKVRPGIAANVVVTTTFAPRPTTKGSSIMGSKATRTPGYLLHKATGQARVRIQGRDYYLGRHNSPENWKRYRQLIAQYFANDQAPLSIAINDCTSVAELVSQYVEFTEEHYAHNSDELYRIKAAIRILIEHYGSIGVNDFSPKKLKDVRQRMIDRRNSRTGRPLSRKYVNQLIGVVKKIFKWGVNEELVPVTVHMVIILSRRQSNFVFCF